jgi:hypothetical protein
MRRGSAHSSSTPPGRAAVSHACCSKLAATRRAPMGFSLWNSAPLPGVPLYTALGVEAIERADATMPDGVLLRMCGCDWSE